MTTKFNIGETVYYLTRDHYINHAAEVSISATRTVKEHTDEEIVNVQLQYGKDSNLVSQYLPYEEYKIGLGAGQTAWVKEKDIFKDPHDAFKYQERLIREAAYAESKALLAKEMAAAQEEIEKAAQLARDMAAAQQDIEKSARQFMESKGNGS